MRPRIAPVLGAVAVLAACERGLHEMYDQAKYRPLAPSALFADGNSSRPQVPETVPYSAGSAAVASSGRNGTVAAPISAGAGPGSGYDNPLPITMALLIRGRQRFDIYCAPCHGEGGEGEGMIVRRGFPAPPSYHTDRLRAAPDRHFFEVITRGYGAMYPYADRVAPEDRWAITAYIRALQLSRRVPVAWLSAEERRRLPEPRP